MATATDTAVLASASGGPARRPDAEGFACRDGVRTAWARFGTHGPHVVLLPTWSIVPSRFWKLQVPYLARHYRVTTFDGRGSGRSDRPSGAEAYADDEYAADTVAVMDTAEVDHAVLVTLSCATSWAVRVAARHSERVDGLFAIGSSCGFAIPNPERDTFGWGERLQTHEGWGRYNKHYWLAGEAAYDDFVRFFFAKMYNQPHSTKQIEDAVGWGHEIDPAVLVDTTAGRLESDGGLCSPLEALCRQVRCPVLAVHGTHDAVRPPAISQRLVDLTGGELLLVEGGGHGLPARDPVLVNLELRRFVDRVSALAPDAAAPRPAPARRTWTRAMRRSRRALYLCSPVGLGHARRDLAIAAELRRLQPDLEIDWLTQDPVTRVLRDHGERVHPASEHLASESAHFEEECAEHDLHAFQAIRRMDEILVQNFMVFLEVVQDHDYDLVVGDEAWDVDYFLHENPELKRAAFAWLTDFIGWLPMPEGGAAEAALTADYNAEMIEHRARFGRVRDRSIFVGDPQDVVDASFGAGLPRVRDWTADNFDFAGYVTGFDPHELGARDELRERLGYRPDERICLVTVGGSGVGLALLRRVADAVGQLRRRLPELRVVLVTGPRIDPDAVPRHRGLDVHGYLPDLHHHLAACDVAVVQGGLTTCMELTANRRPFVYVPLRRHFEQNYHVRHRLERYGAGLCLQYEQAADPDTLAEAVASQLEAPVDYRPVETGGAARAARLLADLL